MKIGVGSFAFRWGLAERYIDVYSFLAKCRHYGAEAVQLCENLNLTRESTSEIDRIARAVADNRLSVELGCRGCDPAHLLHNLSIAKRLGATLLRVVLSREGEETSKAEVQRNISTVIPEFAREDVTLSIENHFQFTPEQIAELVTGFSSTTVSVCLDPLNSISRLVGPRETVDALLPLVSSMHIKDARTERLGTGFAVVGVPLGEGLVDVKAILRDVAAHHADIAVHIEGWIDQQADMRESAAMEERSVTHAIEYLKQIMPLSAHDPERF